MEQQSISGAGIKKDRPSIFSRKKGKSQKQYNSASFKFKNSLDTSFTTENSSSAAPQSESICSIESQHTADDTDLSTTGNDTEEKSKVVNGKHFSGSSSNISSGAKNSSFSLLSKIRQSKKISTSSKSSDENDGTAASSKQKEHVDEDGKTWIYDIFQGTYTTITRCLNCETVIFSTTL